jgi:ferrochelatase
MAGHRPGIVLTNLGGPRSIGEIRPFLRDLFADPAIIPLPDLLRLPLASFISKRRAPKVAPHYDLIGGASPLVAETEREAMLLREALRERGIDAAVTVGMRYGKPSLDDALVALGGEGIDSLLLVPLFPYRSAVTTGSAEEAFREVAGSRFAGIPVTVTGSWADAPAYLGLVETMLRETLEAFPAGERETLPVIAVAHAVPMKLVKSGDPYRDEVQRTVDHLRGVVANPLILAFQSRVGPVRWTGPDLPDVIRDLARDGTRDAVLLPLGFVSDHLETLWELDIQVRGEALAAGFTDLVRVPVFNHRPEFITFLATMAEEALRAR